MAAPNKTRTSPVLSLDETPDFSGVPLTTVTANDASLLTETSLGRAGAVLKDVKSTSDRATAKWQPPLLAHPTSTIELKVCEVATNSLGAAVYPGSVNELLQLGFPGQWYVTPVDTGRADQNGKPIRRFMTPEEFLNEYPDNLGPYLVESSMLGDRIVYKWNDERMADMKLVIPSNGMVLRMDDETHRYWASILHFYAGTVNTNGSKTGASFYAYLSDREDAKKAEAFKASAQLYAKLQTLTDSFIKKYAVYKGLDRHKLTKSTANDFVYRYAHDSPTEVLKELNDQVNTERLMLVTLGEKMGLVTDTVRGLMYEGEILGNTAQASADALWRPHNANLRAKLADDVEKLGMWERG